MTTRAAEVDVRHLRVDQAAVLDLRIRHRFVDLHLVVTWGPCHG